MSSARDSERSRPPVAVVALGDLTQHDAGAPLRVLGRVRTLIGELGCARMPTPDAMQTKLDAGVSAPGAQSQASLALALPGSGGSIVEWIECSGSSARLDPLPEHRRRIVLVDTVELGGKPGSVYHWHLEAHGPLTLLRHYGRQPGMGLDHLAFWLEDDLPAHGIDLIGIEPQDTSAGDGLSRAIRNRLPTICAQVAALLFRVLVEEGW
jgi:Ni,Fe-hydrogenase maturation factor